MIPSESFEVALCLFSIPYIGENAAEKIYESLAKDGVCICVYYNKPYLSPDSVYFKQKEMYGTNIKPNVKKVVAAFRERFATIEDFYLANDEAYKVSIFRKV